MKIIKAEWHFSELMNRDKYMDMLFKIEKAGRTSYKSKSKEKNKILSSKKFAKMLIERGHESVLEHINLSIIVITNRGVSHEWVRHRHFSFTQESSRYCNYSRDRFENQITVIEPCYFEDKQYEDYQTWREACEFAERKYFELLDIGCKPEEARAVLPLSLKTELYITANIRAWRDFLKLRTKSNVHPQMLEITESMLLNFSVVSMPELFNDIYFDWISD